MEFTAGAWWIVTGIASVAVAIISFFLKRTIGVTDRHDMDINEIKRTYVTKQELADVKNELREDIAEMKKDLKEIKEDSLMKKDFYRTQSATDQKLDKIYDLIIADRGGNTHGK